MSKIKHDHTPTPHPLILAIETATSFGSVALMAGETCLAESTLNSTTTHSRRITSQLESIMTENGVGFNELDCIGVSQGPGSFTGLRIGFSTAKGLALAANIPLVAVPTLDALAMQIWSRPGSMVCTVLDARKKEVYAALYKCDESGSPVLQGDYLAIKPQDIIPMIDEPTVFVGDGTEVYGELFRNELGEKYIPAPPSVFMPRASAVGTLASRKFLAQEMNETATMVPLYVRPSEAEVSRAEKLAGQKTTNTK